MIPPTIFKGLHKLIAFVKYYNNMWGNYHMRYKV